MAEIDLLRTLPKVKRNMGVRQTANKEENRLLALQFGYAYFDGTRDQGYGGYRYDGRWKPVARDMIAHWNLKPGDRVLDVGCAKGFLVKDLLDALPGLEVFGLDYSAYALEQVVPGLDGRLIRGTCEFLPFADRSFSAVICINTIHNLPRARAITALREVERLAPGRCFVQFDAYRTEHEREVFTSWQLTCKYFDTPEGWRRTMARAGYTGDYFWTIVQADPDEPLY